MSILHTSLFVFPCFIGYCPQPQQILLRIDLQMHFTANCDNASLLIYLSLNGHSQVVV